MLPSTHESLFRHLRDPQEREAGWATFVHRYRPVIARWCAAAGLCPETAADLTQAVLLKLLKALPEYAHDPDRGRFRSWLKTVVRHAIADHCRAEAARGEIVQSPELLDARAGPEGDEPLAEEGHALDALSPVLLQFLRRAGREVQPKTWEVFVRLTAFEAPVEVVAADLGLSRAAVRQAEYRVKKMLQECLSGQPTIAHPPPENRS